MSERNPDYDYSVFINCPFDRAYQPILYAVVFAISRCGFIARSTLEEPFSADNRLSRILKIISECKYGIHDISRTEIDQNTNLPRFNMPLELGIFLGVMMFGDRYQKGKRCLILDAEPYRYRQTISDIAGHDIDCHHNDKKKAITCVRNWLANITRRPPIPSGSFIAKDYAAFRRRLPGLCEECRLDMGELTFLDFTTLVARWLWDTSQP